MPQDVPEDVWLEIMESIPGVPGVHGRKGLQGLTLTCQRFRRLALPILYRTLQFSLTSEGSLDNTKAALIRACVRVHWLRGQRHLLQHVRRLYLVHWDAPGFDDSIGHISATIYDSVAGLISCMPALQYLELWDSSMTYILYDAISSRPLLTSLHVSTGTYGNMNQLNIPIEISYLPHIRHLHYVAGYSNSTEHYLSHILTHCILHLESLGIHSSHLSIVIALVSNRTLSITSLHVTFPCDIAEAACSSAMWDVLHASPELRVLRVHGNPQDILSPRFSSHFLPHLVDIYGTASHVRALSGGKNITSIHINQVIDIGSQYIVDLLSCSTTALLNLTIRVCPRKPDDILVFLRSLCIFRNLQYMRLSYQLRNIDWNVEMDIHRVQNAVGGILRSFSNLRTCHIYNEYHELCGGDVGCPIGTEYDPGTRGHPSLERLRVEFLSIYMWCWISQIGWTHGVYTTKDWI